MTLIQQPGPAGILPANINVGPRNTFASEKANSVNKPFGFTVTNASGGPLRIYITPGYRPTLPANTIKTGAIVANLTAASTGDHSIEEFLEWIKFHPTRVSFLQINTNNTAQLQNSLTIQGQSLFGDPQTVNLLLASYGSPQNPNDKMIIVDREDWQLDNDTQHSIIIPDATTTTFQFFFGAHIDHAGALKKVALQSK